MTKFNALGASRPNFEPGHLAEYLDTSAQAAVEKLLDAGIDIFTPQVVKDIALSGELNRRRLNANELNEIASQEVAAYQLNAGFSIDAGYHKTKHLTQIQPGTFQIIQIVDVVYRPPKPPPPRARDPLHLRINMSIDSAFEVVSNVRTGKVMKVVARKGCINEVDLKEYLTKKVHGGEEFVGRRDKLDVQWVGDTADEVAIKDIHEDEFKAGHGVRITSVAHKDKQGEYNEYAVAQDLEPVNIVETRAWNPVMAKENEPKLNADGLQIPNVQPWDGTNENRPETLRDVRRTTVADTSPPLVDMNHLTVSVRAKEGVNTYYGWEMPADLFDLSMHQRAGFAFEPRQQTYVGVDGQNIDKTIIPEDANHAVGTIPKDFSLERYRKGTLAQTLGKKVSVYTRTLNAAGKEEANQAVHNATLAELAWPHRQDIKLLDDTLNVVGNKRVVRDLGTSEFGPLLSGHKEPVSTEEAEKLGLDPALAQKVTVEIGKGLLTAFGKADLAGIKIQLRQGEGKDAIGFGDVVIEGAKNRKVKASPKMSFVAYLANPAAAHAHDNGSESTQGYLELLIKSPEGKKTLGGVPSESILIDPSIFNWKSPAHGNAKDC